MPFPKVNGQAPLEARFLSGEFPLPTKLHEPDEQDGKHVAWPLTALRSGIL